MKPIDLLLLPCPWPDMVKSNAEIMQRIGYSTWFLNEDMRQHPALIHINEVCRIREYIRLVRGSETMDMEPKDFLRSIYLYLGWSPPF